MVRKGRTLLPDPVKTEEYKEYVHQYEATYHSLKDESKRLVETLQ
jgi:hypothetical protein